MKKILRHYVVATVSLYLISRTVTGLSFEKGIESLLLAGVGVGIMTLLIRPIINILLLPINLITFGLFKWVSSAVTLYLVTLLVPGFTITGFFFSGYPNPYFSIPPINLGGIVAYVAFSFLLSLISSLMFWIMK